MDKSDIYRCERIIREIANDIASHVKDKPFLEEMAKKLRFESKDGWIALCSVMDVISDTEMAKENFSKFSLSGPTKITDYGEQYLRLYGILNAVYLQKNAILSFVELVKLKDKKSIITQVQKLEIIKLRHLLAAHTVDYLNLEGKVDPHQFQRGPLASSISIFDSKNTHKKYDLNKLLNDYDTVMCKIIIDATNKFICTALKNGGEKLKKYKKQIDGFTNGEYFIYDSADQIIGSIKLENPEDIKRIRNI